MIKTEIRIVLSAALFAAVAALAVPTAKPVLADDSKVVAKVNGTEITERDLKLAEAEIGGQLDRVPAEARRRVYLEFLIENQLVADKAAADKLGETADFSGRMAYWKRRSLRETYFEKMASGVDEAELKALYDKEVKGSSSGEEVRASHILVDNEDKAKEIYELLVHDGDFADLAKKHSKDPGSGPNGGDLGYFDKGMMVPQFEKVAFALKKDEISDPVKSQFGWHIIKLVDRRQRAAPPFDAVKPQLETYLLRQKVRVIVDDLRKSAQLEYIDPEFKKQVEAEKKR